MSRSRERGAARLTVLYDADCRLCTRIAGRLAGADHDRRLRVVPLQLAAGEGLEVRRLAARRELAAALHVVDSTGAWASGGEAVIRACEQIPALRLFVAVARLPLVSALVEPGYRLIAGNRARFGWLAGSLAPAQRIGRGEASRAHGRVEAGDRPDGEGGDDATDDGHGRDDRRPLL